MPDNLISDVCASLSHSATSRRIPESVLNVSSKPVGNLACRFAHKEDSFAGIVVATTMWDSVPRLEISKAMERHREFSVKACKDIVDKGGRIVTLTALQVDEAKILEHIIQKGRRLTLAFQQQLITQEIPLHETKAGKLLLRMPNSRTDYSAAIIEELRASQPSSGKASEDTVYSVKKGQKALENVIEDASITLKDIGNAWKENLHQEDLALDQALQHTEALIRASDANLTHNIQSTAVSRIASSLESMPDYTTASSSASTMDDSSTLQNRSALNTPAISEMLLQRQVLQKCSFTPYKSTLYPEHKKHRSGCRSISGSNSLQCHVKKVIARREDTNLEAYSTPTFQSFSSASL